MLLHEVRDKYLKFFENKGHAVLPSASLVPENDPTTLFTGSGMQPMVPYLLGTKHPLGNRISDSQKSFRANDIEEVGDNRHTTFFEMLGNWSLGDYFKKEQIPWVFEFLTQEIGLDPKNIYVTVFSGDEKNGIPKDTETVEIWKDLFKEKGIEATEIELESEKHAAEVGMQDGRIFYYGDKNWWSRTGKPESMPKGEPGGPDSEMFYEFSSVVHDKKYGENCHPNCDCGRYLEIGNSVFMEYMKNEDGSFSKLPQKNVDFGGGLERITAASINDPDVFSIDAFQRMFDAIKAKYGPEWDYNSADEGKKKVLRIIADHLRSAVFLIDDGVLPSNTYRGYFVRRLLRRAIYKAYKLAPGFSNLFPLTTEIVDIYKDIYPSLKEKYAEIQSVIESEEIKFQKTLATGLKQFEKGADPFILFTSYGFPIELTEEIGREKGVIIDRTKFDEEMKKHQELSRKGAEQKFKNKI